MISDHQPSPPNQLHELAREILGELQDQPAAAALIIGGGVALQHYCEYRERVRQWVRHSLCQVEELP